MNNIIFTLNGTPINMTDLWNSFRSEEDCIRMLCTKYAADPSIAKRMVEDFKTQAGIGNQQSVNHFQNEQKKENNRVNVVSLRCPDCNASLEYERGRNTMFCQYCGAKILLMNENEHIYKHIDEAGIKQAETERIIKLKELELEEKKAEQKKKYILIWICSIGVLAAVALIMILLGKEDEGGPLLLVAIDVVLFGAIMLLRDSHKEAEKGKIVLPMSISRYKDMDYRTVEAELRRAGFYNIRCIEMCDLKAGFFNRQNQVAALSVDGNESVVAGHKYLPEAPIVITYHSFGSKR